MSDPIEVTTRYATSVDDLAAAWAFVMDHIDAVGGDPTVEIKPFWSWSVHDMDNEAAETPLRRFEVVVSGMVHKDEAS